MPTRLFRYLALFFLAGEFSGSSLIRLHAQATNGTIQGTVTGPSGAVVNGATIEVKNLRTGVARSAVTNEQGRYRVPDLIVGEYETQVKMNGFQTSVQRNIAVTVGSERVITSRCRLDNLSRPSRLSRRSAKLKRLRRVSRRLWNRGRSPTFR